MNTGWDLLARHMEEKHPDVFNFGDTVVYNKEGVLASQLCFICGEELVPSPEEVERGKTVPFEPEAVKAYLDECIRFWRARVGSPDWPCAHCSVDTFQSVRTSLFGELLPPDGEKGG